MEYGGTSVTSDKLEIAFNDGQTEFTFTGNVKLNAPEFSAECTAAKVTASGHSVEPSFGTESIAQILATGPLSLCYGNRRCAAEYAEITPPNSTIFLYGKATIGDAIGTVSGDEICINYKTKSIEISSNSGRNPVAVTVDGGTSTPPQKNATPIAAPLSGKKQEQ
jgi:lipopolysaccharide export system protein LptA